MDTISKRRIPKYFQKYKFKINIEIMLIRWMYSKMKLKLGKQRPLQKLIYYVGFSVSWGLTYATLQIQSKKTRKNLPIFGFAQKLDTADITGTQHLQVSTCLMERHMVYILKIKWELCLTFHTIEQIHKLVVVLDMLH